MPSKQCLMTKVMVIDYSGHPFQVQLSRSLAAHGFETLHAFAASSETPKGELERRDDDPQQFSTQAVSLNEPFNKTDFVKRRSQERRLGRLFAELVSEFQPELIIASNCPIETLRFILKAKRQVGAKFIFWLQDLLGEATTRVLAQRLGPLGYLPGYYYQRLERGFLREADHIVAISDDFLPILRDKYGISPEHVTVIENWSPIDDLPLYPRDNDWAQAHLPPSDFRIIYSGTLGFKQDPAVLLKLAEKIDCEIIVFSQGEAANRLAADAARRGLGNLSVRPWLPFAELPKALAGADLLIVLLEPDAGIFSVPSKVLTYLCSGRAILGSISGDNLAAKIINHNGAGATCEPGDHEGLINVARAFYNDRRRVDIAGRAGRAYAENTFDIAAISARFKKIIDSITEKTERYVS